MLEIELETIVEIADPPFGLFIRDVIVFASIAEKDRPQGMLQTGLLHQNWHKPWLHSSREPGTLFETARRGRRCVASPACLLHRVGGVVLLLPRPREREAAHRADAHFAGHGVAG